MRSTTTYNRGDVVFVPFRFTARDTKSKQRPAVVISSDAYHDSRNDVMIAGITSNLAREGFVGQVTLSDWQASGLSTPSAVSGIIMTVRDSVIARRVGALTGADRESLDNALRESLGQ